MAGRPEKFPGLRKHLETKVEEAFSSGISRFQMSFAEIEALGSKLPHSAHTRPEWWYNKGYTRPWTKAEFTPEKVSIKGKSLTFRYTGSLSDTARHENHARRITKLEAELQEPHALVDAAPPGSLKGAAEIIVEHQQAKLTRALAEEVKPYRSLGGPVATSQRCRHPIYGALKGHIRLVAGTDLTKPADPDWGDRAWPDEST